ncbi:MAG: hypothetical protein HUU15_02315 [Candidatus Brocadiae bacterium]|nr:hypothetical protein [Candidatus Brocadiia bacterium]
MKRQFDSTLSRLAKLDEVSASNDIQRLIEEALRSLPASMIDQLERLIGSPIQFLPQNQVGAGLPTWALKLLRMTGLPQTPEDVVTAAWSLSKEFNFENVSAPSAQPSYLVSGVVSSIVGDVSALIHNAGIRPGTIALMTRAAWIAACKALCAKIAKDWTSANTEPGLQGGIDSWEARCMEDCDAGPRDGNTAVRPQRENSEGFDGKKQSDPHRAEYDPFRMQTIVLFVLLGILFLALLVGLLFGAFFTGPEIAIGAGIAGAAAAIGRAAAAILALLKSLLGDHTSAAAPNAAGAPAADGAVAAAAAAVVNAILAWLRSLSGESPAGSENPGSSSGSGLVAPSGGVPGGGGARPPEDSGSPEGGWIWDPGPYPGGGRTLGK